MDEILYKYPQEQYSLLRSHIDSIEPYIRQLYHDYRLLEKGFKLTYAVDFHEVWSFADPVAQFLRAKHDDPSLTGAKEYVLEKQVARSGLFYGLGADSKLVLLPPYVVELNDKMTKISSKLLASAGYSYRQEWLSELTKLATNSLVREALKDLELNRLKSEHLEELQLLLEEKIGELIFLVSGVAGQGLDIIRNLLSGKDPQIYTIPQLWPEWLPLAEKIMKDPPSEWYRRFGKIRRNPISRISNFHDSKAIDFVQALNKHLVKNGEIVIIVSDALAMKTILADESNQDTKIKIEDFSEPVPIFRSIDYFYYRLLFQYDMETNNLDKGMENLNIELDRINRVSLLGKSMQEVNNKCGKCMSKEDELSSEFHSTCIGIQQEIKDHIQYYEKLKNVRLASNMQPVLYPYLERVEKQQIDFTKKMGKATLSLVSYLSNLDESFGSKLRNRERKLIRLMDNNLKEALNLIATEFDSYEIEVGTGLERFTRTRYRIDFKIKKVSALIKEMEKARYIDGDAAKVSRIFSELIEIAFQRKNELEESLLLAVLLLCYRLPERAIELSSRVINNLEAEQDKNTDKYLPEYHYVRVLSLYELEDFNSVIKECEINIQNYASDARFYHLSGLAISKLLDITKKTQYSWDDAIRYARKAHTLVTKVIKDKDLQGAAVNNLAYFYFRRAKQGDLVQAYSFVKELQRVNSSFEKTPEFLHTIGSVLGGLALEEKNAPLRSKFILDALENLQKAYKLARDNKINKNEIEKYENDLRDLEQQLRAIK